MVSLSFIKLLVHIICSFSHTVSLLYKIIYIITDALAVVDAAANDNEPGDEEGEAVAPPEDLNSLTVVQLRSRLRSLNLPVGGRKLELIGRLSDHYGWMVE